MLHERYALRRVHCTLLVKGVGDTYLVVTDTSRYILRVYRSSHRSPEQIAAELELLLTLHKAAVRVSHPLKDKEGELIQTLPAVEGPRYAVLFTYAPGEVAAVPSDRQLELLGEATARFHNVSAGLKPDGRRWTYDLDTTLHRPLAMVEPFFGEYPDGYAWLKDVAVVVGDRLQKLDTEHFSRGFCHFDLLPKNFHFKDDTVTLFDFDFMGNGWLVNDLTAFWQHLQVEAYTGRTTQVRADEAYQRFLKAYQAHRALTEDELQAVPYLTPGFWVFYMGFHTTHDHFLPYLQLASLRPRVKALQQIMTAYV